MDVNIISYLILARVVRDLSAQARGRRLRMRADKPILPEPVLNNCFIAQTRLTDRRLCCSRGWLVPQPSWSRSTLG